MSTEENDEFFEKVIWPKIEPAAVQFAYEMVMPPLEWSERLFEAYCKANRNRRLLVIRHEYETAIAFSCSKELAAVFDTYGLVVPSNDLKDSYTLRVDPCYLYDDVLAIMKILAEVTESE